jgi:hypothetical protein
MTSGYMLLTFDVAFDDVGVFFSELNMFFWPFPQKRSGWNSRNLPDIFTRPGAAKAARESEDDVWQRDPWFEVIEWRPPPKPKVPKSDLDPRFSMGSWGTPSSSWLSKWMVYIDLYSLFKSIQCIWHPSVSNSRACSCERG